MNFIESIQSGFKNSFVFKGRASRSEYNYWTLFSFVLSILLLMIDEILLGLMFIIFIPSLSLAVRRLHDVDRKGWHLLWYFTYILIPFIIIYLMVKKGTIGENSYGEDPLKEKSPNDIPPIVDEELEKEEQKSEDLDLIENQKTQEEPSIDDSFTGEDPLKNTNVNDENIKEAFKTNDIVKEESELKPESKSEKKVTNNVASLYDKFPHLNEEPKEFNFGKMMGLPFFTLMLAFDDDGDEQEQKVIGNIMREVWGVPIFTTAKKADEMFNELAVWYNALNELPEHGTNEKYAIIEWVIESLKHPSGLIERTMMDLMVQKGAITEESGQIWGPKYFMESLIKIANANNKITDREKNFLLWCADHLGYDIDFNTLTFTLTQSSEPPLTDEESEKEEQKSEDLDSIENQRTQEEPSIDDSSTEVPVEPVESSGDPVEDFRSFLANKNSTLKLPKGKKYVEFPIGKGMLVCCMVKTNGVNVYLYSGGKVPAKEVFDKLNSLGVTGKVINDKYTITPMPGSRNANVVRIDLLIPYGGRDLNSNELRDEVYDVYNQLLELCKALI